MSDFKRVRPAVAAASVLLYGVLASSPLGVTVAQAQFAQAAVRTDYDIQTDVNAALAGNPQLQGQHITAATIQGDVTLSGTVADDATKQLAQRIVSGVSGVHSVENNIAINKAAASQPAPATSSQDAEQTPPPPPYDQGVSNPDEMNDTAGGPPPQQGQAYPPVQANGQQQPYDIPPDNGYPGYQGQGYQGQGNQDYPPPTQQASGPVTIPAGTMLDIRTSEMLDARKMQPGTIFQATVANPVYSGNVLAIPRGAVLTGRVTGVRKPGDLAGKSGLQLQVTSLNMGGVTYPLVSDTWTGEAPGKGGYSAGNTVGGAGLGAVIGAIAGGGPGAAIGAVAGGVTGLAASAASKGPRVVIPAEAVLSVHLTAPVTVTPVSYQEAQRLAQSVPQQPRLMRRPAYVYGYPYPYPYYYPYYHPYYYRPYYYGYPRW